MYEFMRTVMGSMYARIAVGGIIGFCGVVAGIYVGAILVGQDIMPRLGVQASRSENFHMNLEDQRASAIAAGRYPDFDMGDLFPWVEYRLLDGSNRRSGPLWS
ncbi:MAG: hypothetical protein DRP45_12160 [Candidatus Zixiibacteriota bacterium]|nr:MAG: hypothetical protein DRP45_12160 [candidate division Zixibacteria bacterium]